MRTALDVDALTAIDVHVHAHAADAGDLEVTGAARRYFGESGVPLALDELAAYYRERNMACVLFTVD
ncbi:MAG TPA: 4-hydroxyphenyl-beta-ketoacyl-CoA hydrolase, partial [Candidatus Elarobacter sp.]|nr:4-hydroxyphenyl-beta-ketoacyl-CoA hydrolase [Candidatus Elarobacter sp.]